MILVVALLLAFFVLPAPWSYLAVIGAATIEAAEVWLFIWYTKRGRPAVGVETLVGRLATVARPCRPRGQVRVAGELWEARCDQGADAGEEVRVSAVDGLMLVVERA